jgi:hypothetical protein
VIAMEIERERGKRKGERGGADDNRDCVSSADPHPLICVDSSKDHGIYESGHEYAIKSKEC